MTMLTIPATYHDGVLHSDDGLPSSRWKVLVTFLEEDAPVGDDSADLVQDNPLAIEEAAFAAMHAQLKELYFGEYVAIVENNLVDHDPDLGELSKRVYQVYGNRPILLTIVNDKVEQTANVPSTWRLRD